ncbi:hypothetical protein HJC23_010993 [Cyclotella cryptica]|uniref:Uncharacterized protein n=1 Tax=Cyclotella cryptica TaxID=29204 RepID=A0ABD3PYB5_9STRA|eukprot:CCRYP_010286-RA/>CCRYP_010286-RA protein AED:0.21 eAED:0.21 QI:0/-1/0/1/-1/1/1/0/758
MRVILTLCLLHQTTVAQTLLHVCGSNYTEAVANCATNPTCPAGDGCPADKDTCFALPESECFLPESVIPTPSPVEANASNASSPPVSATTSTLWSEYNISAGPSVSGAALSFASPTAPPQPAPTHTFVCGMDYMDAATNCTSNDPCPSGDGCGNLTCYAIPIDACQTATSSSPFSANSTSSPAESNSTTMVPTPSPSNSTDGGNATSPSPTSLSTTVTSLLIGNETDNSTTAALASTAPPSDNTTELSLNTTSPSPAPTYNTRFCGSNYTDATTNCSPDRACPGGFECTNGETCFAGITCPVPTPVPTEAPTMNNRFCGVNYTHAMATCSLERACPMGVECPDGLACFAGIACPATSMPPSPKPTAVPTEEMSIVPTPLPSVITQFCGMNYTDAEANCSPERGCPLGSECFGGMACFGGITFCPVKNVTIPPSPAPTMNTYYCGVNYTEAMESCSTERACPSGFGCPDGMTCYGGVTSCAVEVVETASPSPVPSNVTVPTRFCGANSTDAEVGCSMESACPLGNECGHGFACFSNIMCPALEASLSPTPSPNNATASTSSPSIRGSSSSISPSSGSPTESSSEVNLWYCGSSPEDAAENCSTNQPCPDGTAASCSAGQTCFPIPEACNITTAAPSASVTNAPTLDTSSLTSFCGKNWTDAMENCYTTTPCPGGSSEECPDHQGCFQGILNCAAPNRSDAAFFNPYGQETTESSSQDRENSFAYGMNPGYIKSSSCISWGRSNAALVVAGLAGIIATVL